MKKIIPILLLSAIPFALFSSKKTTSDSNAKRADITLNSLYENYGIEGSLLLRETFPFDEKYSATYLASQEQAAKPNAYSYLWPYSGTFSSVSALFEATRNKEYIKVLDKKVLPGLEEYLDAKRSPSGYASYINSARQSDRFYDDNVWIGIDFTDVYLLTKNKKYLDKAKLVWEFVMSGTDDELGGGIYWCEQKKHSKNTCSNAPGAVYALKLYEATKDKAYLNAGRELYSWTKDRLQDDADYLYFDNMKLSGKIGREKYAYNSGQMMQAAALLYKITGDKEYLIDAQRLAASCYAYFFEDFKPEEGEGFRIVKTGNVWFTAVMFRGFIELYQIDKNKEYIEAFGKTLNYAWVHSRDEHGLFQNDWSGRVKDASKWLLTQAAVAEMYARMSTINLN